MCGIFAVLSKNNAIHGKVVLEGLDKLQHRGRDCYGITYIENNIIKKLANNGAVNYFNSGTVDICSMSWMGHLRYATSGDKNIDNTLQNCQPLVSENYKYALAHNGNIPQEIWNNIYNIYQIKEFKLSNVVDTYKLLLLLDKFVEKYNSHWKNILSEIIDIIPVAYSLVIQTNDTIWIARDRFGIRPLQIYETLDCWYVSSEDITFNNLENGKLIPTKEGELINFSSCRQHFQKTFNKKKECIFEYIYFMDKNSSVNGMKVLDFRIKLGMKLSESLKFLPESSLVCGVPQSGIIYGQTISTNLNLEYNQFILRKDDYKLRTFILENNSKRLASCKDKYDIDINIINGRDIVVVDDSIVRGNTIKYLVTLLKKGNPKSIHLVSGCPPIKYPCNYGVDFPDIEELLVNRVPENKLAFELGVESVNYLNIDHMKNIADEMINGTCDACFTGNYLDK